MNAAGAVPKGHLFEFKTTARSECPHPGVGRSFTVHSQQSFTRILRRSAAVRSRRWFGLCDPVDLLLPHGSLVYEMRARNSFLPPCSVRDGAGSDVMNDQSLLQLLQNPSSTVLDELRIIVLPHTKLIEVLYQVTLHRLVELFVLLCKP